VKLVRETPVSFRALPGFRRRSAIDAYAPLNAFEMIVVKVMIVSLCEDARGGSLDEPVKRGADAIEIIAQLCVRLDVAEHFGDIETGARFVCGAERIAKARLHVPCLRACSLGTIESNAARRAPKLPREIGIVLANARFERSDLANRVSRMNE
jgi:hypothetical protein